MWTDRAPRLAGGRCRRPGFAALLWIAVVAGCGDGPTDLKGFEGTWSGVSPGTTLRDGTGIAFTVEGKTILSLSFATENRFGVGTGGPPPGCMLTFALSEPVPIQGDRFEATLKVSSEPMAGVSLLPLASSVTLKGGVTVTGTFGARDHVAGEVRYDITTAACDGRAYAGVGPGFGSKIRSWTAVRQR